MSFKTHQEVIRIYLKKINLKSIEELNDQNILEIIKFAYQDFKKEELSFDDFSTLGEYLFNKLNPEAKSKNFGSVLLEIAELTDFVRDKDNNFTNLTSALINIDNFFKKY